MNKQQHIELVKQVLPIYKPKFDINDATDDELFEQFRILYLTDSSFKVGFKICMEQQAISALKKKMKATSRVIHGDFSSEGVIAANEQHSNVHTLGESKYRAASSSNELSVGPIDFELKLKTRQVYPLQLSLFPRGKSIRAILNVNKYRQDEIIKAKYTSNKDLFKEYIQRLRKLDITELQIVDKKNLDQTLISFDSIQWVKDKEEFIGQWSSNIDFKLAKEMDLTMTEIRGNKHS